jgi:hypothetical protein
MVLVSYDNPTASYALSQRHQKRSALIPEEVNSAMSQSQSDVEAPTM